MKRLLVAAILFAAAGSVSAQKHYTDITFPELPGFEIPKATRVELPNGMLLFLIEDRSLPLVTLSARIGVGSVHEPADKVGLAGVTGTVMRTGGTPKISGDSLNVLLENIAASIETSIGSTSGSAFMSTLTEHVDRVLPLFADVVMNPAFPEDKLELARTQEKSAISRRNDDAQGIAGREFSELIYGSDSPYARSPEYATIDAITRDDMVAFHKAYFHPNNVIIGAWGDFDAKVMADRIRKAFGSWKKNAAFKRPVMPDVDAADGYGVYVVPKSDVTQSTVYMGHRGEIKLNDPDYPAVTVMNEILSNGFGSRLFKNVRDDQGLAYAVFGAYTAQYDRPGLFYAGVMTKSETTVDAAESIITELNRMRDERVTDVELAQAKDAYLNRFVFNFDSRSEVVGRMMTYAYYGYPDDFLDRQKKGIESTTAADVQRVAAKYVRPGDVKILTVGNVADFGRPLSELGEVTEIDITIPTGEAPTPEASEETQSEGRALLEAAVGALGGADAFADASNARMTASQSLTTPDGMTMDVGLTLTWSVPGRARIEQSTPMGALVITRDGETWAFPPQIPEQYAAQMKQQVSGTLWRNVAYLLAARDAVEVQKLDAAELDGTPVNVLLVTPPDGVAPFRLMLDASTAKPLAIQYQAGPDTVRELFGDFRTVGSAMLPFSVSVFQGERKAAEISVSEFETGIEVDDALFRQ